VPAETMRTYPLPFGSRPPIVVPRGAAVDLADRAVDLRRGARGQQIAPVAQDLLGDLHDLRSRLAPAEDHFGKAAAERAVMVDLGEIELAERQSAEGAEERVFVDFPRAELLQQAPEFGFVHEGAIV